MLRQMAVAGRRRRAMLINISETLGHVLSHRDLARALHEAHSTTRAAFHVVSYLRGFVASWLHGCECLDHASLPLSVDHILMSAHIGET